MFWFVIWHSTANANALISCRSQHNQRGLAVMFVCVQYFASILEQATTIFFFLYQELRDSQEESNTLSGKAVRGIPCLVCIILVASYNFTICSFFKFDLIYIILWFLAIFFFLYLTQSLRSLLYEVRRSSSSIELSLIRLSCSCVLWNWSLSWQ